MFTVTIKFRNGTKSTYRGIQCIGMNGTIFDMFDGDEWIKHDIRDIDWWDAV